MLRGNQVDGILISSRSENAQLFADLDLPVVSVERTISQVPSVSCDNHTGGVLAAQTLYRAGCRKALLVSNQIKSYLPAELRRVGFQEECLRLGMAFDKYELMPDDLRGSEGFQAVLQQHPDARRILCHRRYAGSAPVPGAAGQRPALPAGLQAHRL